VIDENLEKSEISMNDISRMTKVENFGEFVDIVADISIELSLRRQNRREIVNRREKRR